jgi:hypothetical protein
MKSSLLMMIEMMNSLRDIDVDDDHNDDDENEYGFVIKFLMMLATLLNKKTMFV